MRRFTRKPDGEWTFSGTPEDYPFMHGMGFKETSETTVREQKCGDFLHINRH